MIKSIITVIIIVIVIVSNLIRLWYFMKCGESNRVKTEIVNTVDSVSGIMAELPRRRRKSC